MTAREVPAFGASDVELAAWMHQLTDDQVQRLTFALLVMSVQRGLAPENWKIWAPQLDVEFNIRISRPSDCPACGEHTASHRTHWQIDDSLWCVDCNRKVGVHVTGT